MGIVSSSVLILSGVYLALGLMYLRFWWAERERLAYLAFTISCFCYMLFAWFEFGMMKAVTPDEYLFEAWWGFIIGGGGIVGFAWFGYLHLQGRKWLFVTYAAIRGLALVLHLIMANGINFRQITSIGHRTILGETLSYPIPVPNPWMLLPHLSHLLLVIFFLDASVRCWRRGEHRTAFIFGTGTVLFGMATLIVPTSVLWGFVALPIFGSYCVLFIIAPMLYELNYDMHRAAMLGEQLEERDAHLTEILDQLQLSAAAANVGLWTRKAGGELVWASKKAGEIWGFQNGEKYTNGDVVQHLLPSDRPLLLDLIRELDAGKNEFQLEYRVLSEDGNIRWVHSRGKVEEIDGSRIVRGAIVDITNLKLAQEAVHDLSRKLINAQEEERARLARELHDDLSQSIALHSIQLASLRNDPKIDPYIKDQLDQIVSGVYRLSEDVHRISHQLHPAKLTQLGLETALRSFCHDIAAVHPLKIDFEAEDLPLKMPDDVALCLYRVTQESLQNIVKHSGAASARVRAKLENGVVHLSVFDNGNGFDPTAATDKEALGLISIDERVRAVNGEAKVTSVVGGGTKIEVHVPISSEQDQRFVAKG